MALNLISSTSEVNPPAMIVNPRKFPRYRIKKRKSTFNKPLKKVSRQLHPDCSVTRAALSVMDDFMNDVFERLAIEAGQLACIRGKKTLTEKEIEAAVTLVLNGELIKHAIGEGSKAIAKYKVHRY